MQSTKVFSKPITAAVTIIADDSVIQCSILVVAGTCTVLGGFPFQGGDPVAITLSAGQGLVLSGGSNSPLDGITITPTGTTNMILHF